MFFFLFRRFSSPNQDLAVYSKVLVAVVPPTPAPQKLFDAADEGVHELRGAEALDFFAPPPQWGGLDLDSRSSGCARLGGGVGPPLGVVVEVADRF